MVEKVERFKAHDGREFLSEEAGLRHEAIEGMIAAVPELALIRPKLEAHLNAISVWCEPLAGYLAKTTLQAGAKTTLEPAPSRLPKPRVVMNVQVPDFTTPLEKALGIRRG